MNRYARIALTSVATSVVIAGAAGVVAVGVLGPAAAQGPGTTAIVSEPAAPPDPATSMDEALARLTQETTGLQAELAAARHRLDSAAAVASGPAAIPGGPASASDSRPAIHPAPPVHTRTGASSATGQAEAEGEGEGEDD